MPQILLAAQTAAGNSEEFTVTASGKSSERMPAHFTCPGIGAGETGTLEKKNNAGTWNIYAMPGSEHIINDLRSGIAVYAPGMYRIAKSMTVAPVPVEVSSGLEP